MLGHTHIFNVEFRGYIKLALLLLLLLRLKLLDHIDVITFETREKTQKHKNNITVYIGVLVFSISISPADRHVN